MRSILKHPRLSDLNYHQHCPEPFPFATCTTVVEVSPHVHFPPTPTLTSTFITHSSAVYDRTPAEVLPNVCALPGRHEREFTDTSYPRRSRRPWHRDTEDPQGGYFSPRGSEAARAFEPSESDDSDAVRTPPELVASHPIAVRFGSRNASDAMLPCIPTQEDIETALLFLPPAPLKMQKGTRRSGCVARAPPRELRRESADGRIQRHNDFAVPTLDFEGCLGGF